MSLSSTHLPSGHSRMWFASDYNFQHLYPQYIQALSQVHWTPLKVAVSAAEFLAMVPGERILDIGSGSGKFCIAAGYHYPETFFYGIEQRDDLVRYANTAKEMIGLPNVSFMHGNMTEVNFSHYDHFYFFNSFYENLPGTYKIDNKLTYSKTIYNQYRGFLFRELEKMPAGTRLATYHCGEEDLPAGYQIVKTAMNHLLNFCVKI
ncbi:Methyltransferase domain-containing protein [Chitinophaga jiangningensis]|uniref:Methyltransferase domain-containing protein n=1 Tax=Chitinophaga jiangningensis TaxID=1419482 RepID=A0A1M7A540_9BACT|nr:methyltransferase domain-containing protein [Chitinophaga jiangningensis]SHL37775.1 Methyltransferase domain-containing protein [Chitinophaga jiangningensis]